MAVVSRPDKENNVTLYDVPDAELEKYKLAPEKAAQMFPKKENKTRADAVAVAKAGTGAGDVHGYSNQDICYAWECDGYGNCVYVWWYC